MPRLARKLVVALGAALLANAPALADKMKNPTAVFAGLDKITGRIISFEVKIDETVQFGSLQLTPRVCYSRPAYEAPRTDTFVEVDEVGDKNDFKRIFTGWMFAASPGLNGVEHPVYDLWLTDCKGGTQIIKVAPEKEEVPEVMPLENKRPATPPPAVSTRRSGDRPPGSPDQQQRQQPTQTFYPTNLQPIPAPAPSQPQRNRNIFNLDTTPRAPFDPGRSGN